MYFNRYRRRSRALSAGLWFPVGRIHRILKERKYSPRVGSNTAEYLSAVLEFLIAEILE